MSWNRPDVASTLALLVLCVSACGTPEERTPPSGADSVAAVPDVEPAPADTLPTFTRPGADTTFYQEAVWSPDGERLLLSRLDIAGGYRSTIAVVSAHGTSYRAVTDGPQDMWATWSPDGKRIAYASTRDGNRDIFVRALDGRGDEIRLTDDPDEDTHPAWSPDGSRILYVTTDIQDSYIVSVAPDGSDRTVLDDSPGFKWNPQWSPDGSLITYYAAAEAGADLIFVMNADGSDVRAVAKGVWPGFSPDGRHILYVRDGEVWQMNLDGDEQEHLFDDAVLARWSPDGRTIAFVRVTWRSPDGWPAISQVFVSRPDESRLRRVTGY